MNRPTLVLLAALLVAIPLSLVAGRSVYLERGFAFVPLQRLVSIIVTRVRTILYIVTNVF